jgi:hypothetical protein
LGLSSFPSFRTRGNSFLFPKRNSFLSLRGNSFLFPKYIFLDFASFRARVRGAASFQIADDAIRGREGDFSSFANGLPAFAASSFKTPL